MRVATLTSYTPGPNAIRLHSTQSRDVLIVAPKRSGKTFSLRWDILKQSWNNPYPDFCTLVTAPTYKHVWMLLERPLVRMYRAHGILAAHNRSEHLVELINGRSVVFRSLDNPDSVEGLDVWRAYTDEFTICTEEACDVVQARCLLTNGAYIRAGTPRGTTSWAYHKYFDADAEPFTGEVIRYQITDNPLITQAALDRIKAQVDPMTYRQDILAEWVNLTDERVYYAFDESANVRAHRYNPSEPVWVGLDYNIGIMAWIAAQRVGRSVHVFAEGYGARTTRDLALQLQQHFATNPPYVYDDASGGIRQQGDAWTQRQVLRQAFPGVRLLAPQVNPERTQRYANVNANYLNGLGQSHLFVDPCCKRLISENLNLVYKKSSDIPDDRNGRAGHITDGLGYMMWGLTGGRVSIAERAMA